MFAFTCLKVHIVLGTPWDVPCTDWRQTFAEEVVAEGLLYNAGYMHPLRRWSEVVSRRWRERPLYLQPPQAQPSLTYNPSESALIG